MAFHTEEGYIGEDHGLLMWSKRFMKDKIPMMNTLEAMLIMLKNFALKEEDIGKGWRLNANKSGWA